VNGILEYLSMNATLNEFLNTPLVSVRSPRPLTMSHSATVAWRNRSEILLAGRCGGHTSRPARRPKSPKSFGTRLEANRSILRPPTAARPSRNYGGKHWKKSPRGKTLARGVISLLRDDGRSQTPSSRELLSAISFGRDIVTHNSRRSRKNTSFKKYDP